MKRRLALAVVLLLFLIPLLSAPLLACPDEDEPCGRCAPRPRQPWAVGLSHFYGLGDGYAWQTMANGEPFDPSALTIAVRVDLLNVFPLDSVVKISSACGTVTTTVTDVMPVHPEQPNVVIDVSPAVAGILFCGGYGWSKRGIPFGEELVLIEIAKVRHPGLPEGSYQKPK